MSAFHEIMYYFSEFSLLARFRNSFMTEAPIIQKPVHGFALQINGLVSL